jgi:AcrR family transcriptional regulator
VTIEEALPFAPPQGRRPRNRRELIIEAAAELFHRDGYEKVSVGTVAGAVNVRPSALYRHFPGKPQLLAAVILNELDSFSQGLAENQAGFSSVLPQLVEASLDHPRLGVLLQREARSLPYAERTAVHRESARLGERMTAAVLAERSSLDSDDGTLLARSVWAVLHSTSRHARSARADYAALLESIIKNVLDFTPAAPAPGRKHRDPGGGHLPQGRRERLLAAAVPLFADQGYASVSMEDIGALAGMAGPSIYHHYTSKQDILQAAITRSDEWLRYRMNRALAEAENPSDALDRLIDSYVDHAVVDVALIDVLITETRNLSLPLQRRITQSRQDYLGEWLHLLRQACPGMSATHAQARIRAALSIINDAARSHRSHNRPFAPANIKALGKVALLGGHPR